ncbi:MAG: preprotein translocase subunit Sec61beta [Candidatus Helarchaeota archaeon]
MSKKQGRRQKRRSREGPMPFAGAGLIRFFQEESRGIKIGPKSTLIIGIVLILAVLMALIFLPPIEPAT